MNQMSHTTINKMNPYLNGKNPPTDGFQFEAVFTGADSAIRVGKRLVEGIFHIINHLQNRRWRINLHTPSEGSPFLIGDIAGALCLLVGGNLTNQFISKGCGATT